MKAAIKQCGQGHHNLAEKPAGIAPAGLVTRRLHWLLIGFLLGRPACDSFKGPLGVAQEPP